MTVQSLLFENDPIPNIPPSSNELCELIAKAGGNVAFVVSYSGGKDSHRMLGFIRENFPHVRTYVVMADTGFEHVRPIPAEEWARDQVALYGLKLIVVRNPNKTYLEMVERRGMFPSPGQRQCTSDLKRGPIDVVIRNLKEKLIISCVGIRAAESTKRATLIPWQLNESLTIEERRTKTGRIFQQARNVYSWMPIFQESLMDVLRWHWENSQRLHPVYVADYHRDGTTGGYLRRFSCRVCIFSTPADLRAIHEHDREAFDAVAGLEQRIGFTMKNGKNLFEVIGQADDGAQYGSEEETPCI